ncbi:ABC transporter permease [Candidatus Aerophobetes bacterium]|nr:ABC transporter permease [Candidatus Aerophobetes bacterium]
MGQPDDKLMVNATRQETQRRAVDKSGEIQLRRNTIVGWLERMNLLVIPLILVIIAMSLLSERFFTQRNMITVMRASSIYIIVGVGQAFLMTSKNIDLSVGSMMGLIMGLVGTFIFFGGSVPLAILYAIGLGLLLGTVNGAIVTKLGVPALLATLGMMVSYRGMVNHYMYGTTVSRFPRQIVYLGQGTVGPIPMPIVIALAVAVLGACLYYFTRFGRYAVAIGGNEEAATLAGIPVKRWKTIFFAFQGLLVGIAALVFLGRLDSTNPGMGTGLELHVIVGVALGGTLLFGGKGSIWGVVLGMFLIAVLTNGLMLAGAGFFIQNILLGILLVGSVALQVSREKARGFD